MISETLRADNGPDPARVRSRSLLLFLVSSIVVHALVIVLPFERRRDASIPPPPILEVVMATQKTEETRLPMRKPQPNPVGPAAIRPKPELRKAVPAQTSVPSALPMPEFVPSAEAGVPVANLPPVAGTQSEPVATKHPEVPASAPVFNAAYLRNPAPHYPASARRRGDQGTVMLKVLVSAEGAPLRIELDQTSGSAPLDGAALDAVKGWRFVPARRGDRSIEDWVRVPIVFRLEG